MKTRFVAMAEETQQLKELKGQVQQLQADMIMRANLTIPRAETQTDLQTAMQQNQVEIGQMIQAMLSNHAGASGHVGSSGGRQDQGGHSGSTHHTLSGVEHSYHDGSGFGDGFKPKTVRLEFPRFDGEDPKTWCCRAEQFL